MKSGFIYDSAPFPSAHAVTLAATEQGLVAAWFAGTREKHRDVGIWVARQQAGVWSPPVEVANGIQEGSFAQWRRYPCWNPVLFQPAQGPLLLYFKVGRSPSRWWGEVMASEDGGTTWSKPQRLPEGILGPIKNKPVELADGSWLSPSSSEHAGWRVHLERSSDRGATWDMIGPLNTREEFTAIQPAILDYGGGRLQILNRSRQGVVTECWSEDGGRNWSPMAATNLPNPDSGIDAVMLRDGRALLVYNRSSRDRSPLNIAVSRDGRDWEDVLVLEDEPGEFSYPAVILDQDNRIHFAYTWNRRRIKHGVIDPAEI
jgi:predicted neuraminidase